jgi:hypothetical protein
MTVARPDASERDQVLAALDNAAAEREPYPHWLLSDVFDPETCDEIAALPFAPAGVRETYGKRDSHNDSRIYFDAANRARFGVCARVAEAMQDPGVVAALERRCGVDLRGTNLRIEYTQDVEGFWLEPHTDIGVKKFTMLVYLSRDPRLADCGTDVYDAAGTLVRRAPYVFGAGLIFIPASDTWHGFARRPIPGVRKSLIINYVDPEWRARHELAFPDRSVG